MLEHWHGDTFKEFIMDELASFTEVHKKRLTIDLSGVYNKLADGVKVM